MTHLVRSLLLAALAIALISGSATAADKPARAAAPRLVINSFNVGNSLTGNAVRFRDFAKTAGIENRSAWFLIGGIMSIFMIRSPAWFIPIDLVLYLPAAWLGAKLAGPGKRVFPA